MSFRQYQQTAFDEIRAHYKAGTKKALLHLATGGGKTKIFCDIIKATADRGNPCVMVVKGRELVEQAHLRLKREKVRHGVLMAKHWNYQPSELIQACSIDTLMARGLRPPASLIVVDEAHLAATKGYKTFLGDYPNAFILAVSATPYLDVSLRHLADVIVKPISIKELIEQGYLVDAKYFAPSDPDLSGVHISRMTGDYVQSELAEVMKASALTGDIVSHWKRLGQNRPTISFASSVEHSKQIVEQFKSEGINAEHCEAETSDNDRKRILGRLESGQTKIVSNVGILCTGVDVPFLSCIIMARPTKSRNLYIQQAGRGTRPFAGKNDFILLDHAGNVLRHGFITEEPDANLDGILPERGGPNPKTCSACYAVFYGFNCECGFRAPVSEQNREILEIDGTLNEITELPLEAQILRDIERLKKERKLRGFKRGWVYYQIRDKYGEELAQRFFKRRELPFGF